jgi:hypothetical protein
MTDYLKKLFENRTVELSMRVTSERARLIGQPCRLTAVVNNICH